MIGYKRTYLLTKQEYDCFPRRNIAAAPRFMRTYFYDTDDLKGNRCGITYRIRETEDGWEGGIILHRLGAPERFGQWTTPARGALDGRVFAPLALRLHGSMTTLREVLQKDPGFAVYLDRNDYRGQTDYELTVCYAKDYDTQAGMLLLALGHELYLRTGDLRGSLSVRQTPPSKSERFFSAGRDAS